MADEVLKSELDLYKKVLFQGSIEGSQFIPYRPVTAINDASAIEFVISGSSDEYIDLQNIFLWVTGKISKQDGNNYDSTQNDKNSLVNYGLNTIFEQVDVYLSNTLISPSSNTYAYKSFIEALTEYDHKSQYTFLRSAGYVPFGRKDTDVVDDDLSKVFNQSKNFKFYGRPHVDVFNCDRLLINGVDIKLNFIRAKDSFCCMGTKGLTATTDTNPKLSISDMGLFVRKVKIAPGVLSAHAKALQVTKAIYPIKRGDIKIFNLPANQSSFVLDNIYLGQMPNLLIVGFVDHKAINGDYHLNPFAFKNFNLNYLSVHINSESFPIKPYTPDYTNDNYEREYFELFHQLGYTNSIGIMGVTYKLFKECVNLYSFNFNADFSVGNEHYINIAKEGSLRVEVKFNKNLADAIKMICYSKFDNTIEIDSNRNVTIDY
jgi:hypothetical protein